MSAGNDSFSEGGPDKARTEDRHRDPERRFELLIDALIQLQFENEIDSWSVVSPNEKNLQVIRNGRTCWSLLTEKDRILDQVPKRAWEVIYAGFDNTNSKQRNNFSRCVLLLRVVKKTVPLLLIEIEPRVTESGFKLIGVSTNCPDVEDSMILLLDAIREGRGAIKIRV